MGYVQCIDDEKNTHAVAVKLEPDNAFGRYCMGGISKDIKEHPEIMKNVAASSRIGGISSITYSDTAKSKKSKLFHQGVYFFGDVYGILLFLLFSI